jgi:prepilin-type N-terminal cleavage/methylation domain-containing protein
MPLRGAAGVTLIEMLIVVALIGLMVGIMFPSVSSGIETMRLNEASNQLVSFLNDALIRAERREQGVEISISKSEKSLTMRSPEPSVEKTVTLPQGISIAKILPEEHQQEEDQPRRFMVYPGGAIPRIGVEIVNGRGVRRLVRVDPITGIPRIERIEAAATSSEASPSSGAPPAAEAQ